MFAVDSDETEPRNQMPDDSLYTSMYKEKSEGFAK